MSDPFLSSDEYDERAHQLYNEGQYDEAIDTLREGLSLYPHAVELHVGMGYARLAREEFAWARRAFEEARGLDPDHEDTLAGLGEVLLKFGERAAALACFDRVLALGFQDDHDLMLQIGRALFREGALDHARRFFEGALRAQPDSADAAACVGYAAHRLADEGGSLHWLRRALELDPGLGEARIYLANLLYDRGEYEAALFHLERTGPEEHYDALAIWRLIELKKSVYRLPDDDPELVPWNERLTELQGMKNKGGEGGGAAKGGGGEIHRVSTVSGSTYVGTWEDIVRQMKDDAAEWVAGSLEEYMEASAKRWRKQTGVAIPATDPESFLRAGADAGILRILH